MPTCGGDFLLRQRRRTRNKRCRPEQKVGWRWRCLASVVCARSAFRSPPRASAVGNGGGARVRAWRHAAGGREQVVEVYDSVRETQRLRCLPVSRCCPLLKRKAGVGNVAGGTALFDQRRQCARSARWHQGVARSFARGPNHAGVLDSRHVQNEVASSVVNATARSTRSNRNVLRGKKRCPER